MPWNAAVSACDKGGQWEVALALLRNSRLQRVKPLGCHVLSQQVVYTCLDLRHGPPKLEETDGGLDDI